MATSPFELFRRNMKPMMIAATLLAMFAFVALPALDWYQRSAVGGRPENSLVASFDDGSFDLGEIDRFMQTHQLTLKFLQNLAEKTVQRGGEPKIPGYGFDPRSGRFSLGIPSQVSRQDSVIAKLLAADMVQLGLELDDSALRTWLDRFVDSRLQPNEIRAVLALATNRQLGEPQLFAHLRTHLLASASQHVRTAGFFSGQQSKHPLLTNSPAEQFELFCRIHQRATIAAYPVFVDEFLDKTDPNPSEEEILATFEAGKTEYPNDFQSNPGFRRPDTVGIQYLTADVGEWIDREVKKLSEADLKAEYDNRVASGGFKVPLDPPEKKADETTPEAGSETSKPDLPETKPEGEPDAEPKQEDSPTTNDQPAEEKADTDTEPNADSKQEDSPNTDDQPAEEKADSDTEPDADSKQEDSPATDDQPAEDKSSQLDKSKSFRLVRFPLLEDPDQNETDATGAIEDAPPADKESESTKTEKTTTPPAVEKEAAKEEKVDKENPEAGEKDEAPAPATKVRPFEEVKDEIAGQLAFQPALDGANRAIDQAHQAMRKNFGERLTHEAEKQPGPAPQLDLAALAEKLNLKFVDLGSQDGLSFNPDPIFRTHTKGPGFQRGDSFVARVFSSNTPLYAATRTINFGTRQPYVFWKTSQTKQYIPELIEVRDEVILAVRQQAARSLAKKAALDLAKKANVPNTPPEKWIDKDRMDRFHADIGPFPWMQWFGPRAGNPMEFNIRQLDRTGSEFMAKVFSQPLNQYGVVTNEPKTVYYIVKTATRSPDTKELHDQFMKAQNRNVVGQIAADDARRLIQANFQRFQQSLNLQWHNE